MRDELTKRLDEIAPGRFRCFIAVDDGWYPLLAELAYLLRDADKDLFIDEIKEKFGAMRIYTSIVPPPEIKSVIRFVERLSLRYCEACGSPASSTRTKKNPVTGERLGFWIKTLCDRCHHYRDVNGRIDYLPSFPDEEEVVPE